jgi:hypothetical protein
VISLNTVIYSRWHSCSGPQMWTLAVKKGCADAGDPFGQFAWLHGRLIRARADGVLVWIIGHIPPVLGSYLADPNKVDERTAGFWRPQWAAQYHALLRKYNDVVKAQLYVLCYRLPMLGLGLYYRLPMLSARSCTHERERYRIGRKNAAVATEPACTRTCIQSLPFGCSTTLLPTLPLSKTVHQQHRCCHMHSCPECCH